MVSVHDPAYGCASALVPLALSVGRLSRRHRPFRAPMRDGTSSRTLSTFARKG